MHDVVDRIDYLHRHQGEILGVPTGFTQLDQLLGGFQKSDLIILAARPAVGKTALSLELRAERGQEVQARSSPSSAWK